ncbi:11745_t:CDS:10 [Funneliformis caledonium]|uniref:Ubiquitin carboxyl-terminal hydrolase n=1 Tax=Funneliformis caledonium TaxID=1117310 RepID=A0A9N9CBK1_9GLOM|nr:11745_t:CDS:10 [Funneliformis caledonium]
MEKNLLIFDNLLKSPHSEEVKKKFIIIYLESISKLHYSKPDWEQLCEYAYGIIKHTSRVHAFGELILSRIARLQKAIYMLYFNSSWITQTLSNNNIPNNLYQQLRALVKIIKYKQEISSDSDDHANVEIDCRILQSYSIKYFEVVKSRVDWMQLFVSMFTELPQSIPEDHVRLIEVLLYSLAIPESDSLESYDEFVKQTVKLIESLWKKSPEIIGVTIREIFIRLSSNQTCSKSIVLLISRIPKSCTSVIQYYVQKIPAEDAKKFELCVERMISMIPHPFANNISCWIIELVKALEKLKDKSILIRITLANASRYRHARSDALMVVKCLLLGYQVAPDVFDSIIPTIPKVLDTIDKERDQVGTLLELSRIIQCLMLRFSGGSDKYLQLYNTLESHDLPVLKREDISNILQKHAWFKVPNIADSRKEFVVKPSVKPSVKPPVKTPVYSPKIFKKKGLQNLGNTCFMNSVLQTLPSWLNNGRQQDCHEFLKQIEEESKKTSNKQLRLESEEEGISTVLEDMTDVPISPFGGKMENIIMCMECGKKSKTKEGFHDLSLSLKVDTSDNLSFSDLLSGFLSDEDLKGDNQYFCERCGGLRDAKKLTRIITPPRYLILSLNRFEYDVKYARRIKIMTHVSIQESLSVPQVHENDESPTESNHNQNGIVNGMINGMMNGEKRIKTKGEDDKIYDLSAIVIHSGSSAEYGHYYTYAKDEDGQWYNYNDSYVSTSSLSRIISEGEDFKSDTPYLLFFQQKNIITYQLPELSQSLMKEVEKEDKSSYNRDSFGSNDFSMDNKKDDKDEKEEINPLSGGYDLFDYDKSVI